MYYPKCPHEDTCCSSLPTVIMITKVTTLQTFGTSDFNSLDGRTAQSRAATSIILITSRRRPILAQDVWPAGSFVAASSIFTNITKWKTRVSLLTVTIISRYQFCFAQDTSAHEDKSEKDGCLLGCSAM
jgi:hypothetical protein